MLVILDYISSQKGKYKYRNINERNPTTNSPADYVVVLQKNVCFLALLFGFREILSIWHEPSHIFQQMGDK